MNKYQEKMNSSRRLGTTILRVPEYFLTHAVLHRLQVKGVDCKKFCLSVEIRKQFCHFSRNFMSTDKSVNSNLQKSIVCKMPAGSPEILGKIREDSSCTEQYKIIVFTGIGCCLPIFTAIILPLDFSETFSIVRITVFFFFYKNSRKMFKKT